MRCAHSRYVQPVGQFFEAYIERHALAATEFELQKVTVAGDPNEASAVRRRFDQRTAPIFFCYRNSPSAETPDVLRGATVFADAEARRARSRTKKEARV